MMDQSTPLNKLLRLLQFRKHLKELTSACKRINQDGCYEFVSQRHPTSSKSKKIGSKFHLLRPKISHAKSLKKESCSTIPAVPDDFAITSSSSSNTTGHRTMIVKQSYKPLHSKCNRNTIAVTKDTPVKILYTVSNWVFIEIISTGDTGFIPIYCLGPTTDSSETPNNLSLFNVSIHEKSMRQTHPPSPGRFITSIGPCQQHQLMSRSVSSRRIRSETFRSKDQSNLSRQISNISLHGTDHDAYGTLNLTPCKSLSMSILDNETTNIPSNTRLRVMQTYQRQFVGDISVLESEVVTQMGMYQSTNEDWRLVRRGDGRQGYIPRQIAIPDHQSH